MICPSCGSDDATLHNGVLQCERCHAQDFVPDPNKTCPRCGAKLRTSDSIHDNGFRVARRACSSKHCTYSLVLVSIVVATREGRLSSSPSYVQVARDIRDGKLRVIYDRD